MIRAVVCVLCVFALLSCVPAFAQVVPVDGGAVRKTKWNGSYLFRGIPSDPRSLLDQAPPRAVIVGTNKVEFGSDRKHRDEFIAKTFRSKEAAARAYYHADQPNDPCLGSLDEQIGTDITFRCPREHLAELLASKGGPVWSYEFDAAPNGGKTSHAAEIGYAFGDLSVAPGLSLKPYWVDFIRSGDPNRAGLPDWPKFTAQGRQHVLFDSKGITVEGPLRPQLCALEDQL